MAASNLNLGKASGGVLNIQPADGTTNTSLVLPASGTVVATDVAVTDNAIARYDGTTGKVQNSGVVIDDNGNILGNGTQTFNGFGGTGFKNYIINGNFDVWQRGTSFTFATNGGYFVDRFKLWASFGTANSVSANKQTGYCHMFVNTAYTGYLGLYQIIENEQLLLSGKTLTMSCEVRTNVAGTSIMIGGTNTRGNVHTGDGTWQKLTLTFNGNIVISNDYFGVLTPLNTAITTSSYIDIRKVQLEEGSIATPFENRPVGLELSLCQRYYQLVNSGSGYANYASTTHAQVSIVFNQTMRTTPTCLGATNPLVVTDSQANYTSSATSVGNWYGTNTGGNLQLQNFTGLTSLRPIMLNPTAGTNNPSIMFSAEL